MLFLQFVSRCYECDSIIITSNAPLPGTVCSTS